MIRLALLLGLIGVSGLSTSPLAAQGVPFLVAPAERGVVLRWVWDEGERPAGYFVERRPAAGGPWARLTPQPLRRIRDRAAARLRLGDQFDRYSSLLFPTDPRAERSDPESFRGLLLLSADLEPGVAHVLGLRYDDSLAVTGTAYQYRLIALRGTGEAELASSGVVVAGSYRPAASPAPMTALTGPRGASLRWTPSLQFSAYHVYRGARRDGADARRLNDAPVILFTRDDGSAVEASATFFTDTLPAPRDTAYYAVEGIDAFGRRSARSPMLAFTRRPAVTVNAPVLVQTRVEGDTVVVSWQPPIDTSVTGYQVWRAPSDTGTFVKLGAPVRAPARELRDPGRPTRRVLWYRVTALDRAGRESDPSTLALAEVPDLTPPAVPDSLAGVADTGRLSLRWRPVRAADLRGYRVYRSSNAGSTFSLLSPTPMRGAQFVDTIRLRADHAFHYRVTAVDSSFNESAPSAVIALRPPDHTPPSAPRIGQVRPLDGALGVIWLANPEADVVAYRLRYRLKSETVWRDAGTAIPVQQLRDTIVGLTPGRAYEMTLVAIDDAGNQSPLAPVVEGTPVTRRAPARPDLRRASYEPGARGVVVTSSAPAEGVVELLVLRREEGQAYRPVGTLEAGTTRFVDRTAQTGRRYEYVVRARDAFGNTSESRSRRVDVPQGGA